MRILPIEAASVDDSVVFFPFNFGYRTFPFSIRAFSVTAADLVSDYVRARSSGRDLRVNFEGVVFVDDDGTKGKASNMRRELRFLRVFGTCVVGEVAKGRAFERGAVGTGMEGVSGVFARFAMDHDARDCHLAVRLPRL